MKAVTGRMGMGLKLLYVLIDGSGSLAKSTYIAKAINSLFEKEKDKNNIVVTVAVFRESDDGFQFRNLYELVPIAKAPPIKFNTGGESPIWKAMYHAFSEISANVARWPIVAVEFVILTDFQNNYADDFQDSCRRKIRDAMEAGWTLTALVPKDSESMRRAGYYVDFPAERVMEV